MKFGFGKVSKGIVTLGMTCLFSQLASAVTIGIVDSGVDLKHKDLAPLAWVNPQEIAGNGIDDDGNNFIDDINGWNFTENNGNVIDYQYLGTFSPDIYKFFQIQGKMLEGNVNPMDMMWMRQKVQDPSFLAQLQVFGNFVHGTHVGGISAKNNRDGKILAVKMIATKVKDSEDDGSFRRKLEEMGRDRTDSERGVMLNTLFDQIISQQVQFLTNISEYLNSSHVDVANGSFGTGYQQISGIVQVIFIPLFGRSPSATETSKFTKRFMKKLIDGGSHFATAASETLFVFAAGNDGLNNDDFPTSPANVAGDNVISVAATQGRSKLASFSNYGEEMVDVAAPGVNIRSTIPGNEYLGISGTSQAAPYVTSVAAQVKSANPQLTPGDIKRILIATVDEKDFLRGKVASGGIVNDARAILAGKLSRQNSIEQAISKASDQVPDISALDDDKMLLPEIPGADKFVLPLPSTIVL